MMRIFSLVLAAFLLASAVFYAPSTATEPEKLLPEEVLWVRTEDGEVIIAGDEVEGRGADWKAAMQDLRETAPGTVFLETVERLIFTEEALGCLDAAREDESLRPAATVYALRGEPDEGLSDFTAAHPSGATLERPENVPLILKTEGRYRLA